MRIKDIAPIILTVTSVASSIAAVVMAVHDTPKAFEIADNHRLEKDPEGLEDLTVKEKIIDYGKAYWKTEALLALSISTSIASCIIGHKNYRALMASTAVLSTAYAKHKDKIKKFVGEEKAKLIDKEVANEVYMDAAYYPTNYNELVWFHDSVSNTDFKMTWCDYLNARYRAQIDLQTRETITLGDLFYDSTLKNDISDKKYLNDTWFLDYLTEHSGISALLIDALPYNFKGQENKRPDRIDQNLNGGKPTYFIQYSMWPLPPSIAKDYQYIGQGVDCN